MRWQKSVAGVLLIFPHLVSGTAFGQGALATPAIDTTIYKEGAIDSREFGFGHWHAKCQEIVKIKRRVCNLLSNIFDAANQSAGSLLIATTDNGIPAIVLAMPFAVTQAQNVIVEAEQSAKVDGKVVRVKYSNIVKPTVCDSSCKYMFPLDSRLIFILNAGEKARVGVPSLQDSNGRTTKQKRREAQREYFLMGDGFAETLKESTKIW